MGNGVTFARSAYVANSVNKIRSVSDGRRMVVAAFAKATASPHAVLLTEQHDVRFQDPERKRRQAHGGGAPCGLIKCPTH